MEFSFNDYFMNKNFLLTVKIQLNLLKNIFIDKKKHNLFLPYVFFKISKMFKKNYYLN